MMFKLQYHFPGAPIGLFSADGRLLARKLEFVCFNDRYVSVSSYKRGDSGIYDSQTNAKVPREDYDAADRELDSSRFHSCTGYYTAILGPSLLLDGQKFPFLPPCAWRNLDNPALKNRAWFDRPCDDRSWREEMRPPTVAGDTAVQSDLGP